MAHKYYQELVGEIFTGSYNGEYYHRGDHDSRTWYKITIDDMPSTMESGLAAIRDEFEGRIWKGFYNDTLYVRDIDHDIKEMSRAKFKIIDYNFFKFERRDFKEPVKYTDNTCYFFIVQPIPPAQKKL